jgi:hypothetical protein
MLVRSDWAKVDLGSAFSLGNRGAEGQDRTGDTRFFRPLLYQLSYLGRKARGAVPLTNYPA